jgi:nitrogen fixation/metabolism regulation signal transduction histidine kinase
MATMVVIGLGLLVLLTKATDKLDRNNQNYEWLLLVNVVVAAALLLTIGWGTVRLLLRLRRGQFGSRLLLKLAAIFALVGVVPGVLIYTVSYQFVSRSIENWFDVQVEGALAAGLTLGRVTLDTLSQDAAQKSRQAALQLAEVSDASAGLALERLREQLGARDVLLWNGSGNLVASVGQSRFQIRPERPSSAQIREARQQTVLAWIEGLDDAANTSSAQARIMVLATVPQLGLSLREDIRLLQVVQDLPSTLVTNALEVQAANQEYQERALAREGLRQMYIGTLTLSLFLAVLGAILLAVLLGNQLARPLLLLAQGMRQVASGDLTPKLALQSRDELGGLTRSFADMTQQLSDARNAALRSLQQLDQARANLQTILDNLTAGVIVLDPEGRILSSNPGATRILRVPVAVYESQSLLQLPQLQGFAADVLQAYEQLGASDAHELDHWQKSFELHASGQGLNQTATTLLARGAVLPDGMRLLVFDDISEIVSVERSTAWGEVARRLAHEIKNPLTPIQLSAERLQRKLDGKLADSDAAVLAKSVRTIVDQVDAMKRLVNEFRDYGRLPAAELKPLDLNALIGDVLSLYGVDNSSQTEILRELDPQCPPIQGDAQQLRQVVHNLLQNAQDACEAYSDRVPQIVIRTEWRPQRQRVRLSVLDSGPGFEPHILQRAFEPYVTTKAKGTGLGLAVVKKIADEHHARIELNNHMQGGQVGGAQVSLSFKVDNTHSGD